MSTSRRWSATLAAWQKLPDELEAMGRAATGAGVLDRPNAADGMSVRETIHHIVEANIVAAGMLIAARGTPGTEYDWTWLFPDRAWTTRQGYARAPIEPAIGVLRGLVAHFGALVGTEAEAKRGSVVLRDSPRGKPYTRTVAEVVAAEVEHAGEHLAEARASIPQTRSAPPKRSR